MWAILRRYRLLIVAVCILGLAALREQSMQSGQLSYVMLELYPGSPRVQAALAMQAVREGDLPLARKIFEQALSHGVTTNEDLLYYYAVTLVYQKASPDQVSAAVERWRFHFPYSERTSPEETIKSAGQRSGVISITPASDVTD